jgi:4-amino-4-deoxy-L-arabinose transferase-like glycosyltransferase
VEQLTGAAVSGGPFDVASPRGSARSTPGWLAPVAIVALALLLRVVAIAADTGYRPQNDSLDYSRHAVSIAAGDGYPRSGILLQGGPTALRVPGYPIVLGAVYAVSGDSVTAGRLLGAALGALAVLFIYLIARTIWGRGVALCAAGLAAIFPPLVLLSEELYSESLFIVLELAAVLAVFAFRRSGGMLRWAALAGLLCGAAALTRNIGLALLAPIAAGLWIARPRLRFRSMVPVITALACALAAMLPWIARNEAEFHQLIPVSSGTGFTLAGTYNPQSFADGASHGGWRIPQVLPEFERLFKTPGLDEAQVDAKLRHRALEFAWEHPGYVAEAAVWNLMRMFELSGGSVVDTHGNPVEQRGIGDQDPASERLGLALAVALAVLGVIAIVRSGRAAKPEGRRRIARGPWFMWAIPILAILTAAPLGGLPRYRLVADPFILLLAGVGLSWLARSAPVFGRLPDRWA